MAATVLVTIAAATAGWAARPQAPAAYSAQAARWRTDLDYLSTQLAAREDPEAFAAGKARFSEEIAALIERAPSASNAQMAVGIMQAVASFGIAHSAVTDLLFPAYPIRLAVFSDGLHVTAVDAAYRDLLGARLVRVGAISGQAAYERVSTVISHENQAWLSELAPQDLTMPTILDGLGILTSGHDELTFRTLTGATVTVSPPAYPPGQNPPLIRLPTSPPLYQQRPEEPFWFSYLAADQTLYVRYTQCTDPAGFAALTKQVFALAATHPVQRLVVDLRQNEGGDTGVFDPFLAQLEASPLSRPGRLYAVIDQGTFSSGMDTAVELASAGATLIGAPTGGKPDSYGEIGTFKLPDSGLTISYATQYFAAAAPGTDPPSLMPAITIEPTFAQYASGDDPVMDAILAAAPGSQPK